MPTADKETLTIDLPVGTIDRIRESARQSHRPLEHEAEALLVHALSAPDRLRLARERSHEEYRDYLRETGGRQPAEEELMQQMRRIREEVANELYPD